MPDQISTDVAIIGAGPVGLFAAFELGMLKLRSVLIDALGEIGGQCTALYPEKPIYDIPAHPAIAAGHLIGNLERQIAPFDVPRLLGRRVERLEGGVGEFVLGTDGATRSSARRSWSPRGPARSGRTGRRWPGSRRSKGPARCSTWCARRDDYRGRRVVIAGGGDSAVDWALSLREVAEKVYVVHRRAKFRAAPETAAQLEAAAKEGVVELVIPFQLHGLQGKGGALTGVEVADLSGNVRLLPADRLLPFFGLSMDLGPIAAWGLDLAHSHVAVDPATCQTACPACSRSATSRAIPAS